jgi:FtsZ-binding cell division protein ZapB
MNTEFLFASALAGADAQTQATFFNDFYRCLKLSSKGRHESQVCYIADYLDENGREFAKELNTFALLAVESRAKLETEVQELYRNRHELKMQVAELREQRATVQELLSIDNGGVQ